MMAWWDDLLVLASFWNDKEIATAYARRALHPTVERKLYWSPFEERIDQAIEVGQLKGALGDAKCATSQALQEVEDLKVARRNQDDKVLRMAWDIEVLRTKLQSTSAQAIVEYK
ncbi:hypothetical protein BHE74_00007999 [Ensete ventricosum]|nr:hypothetical protein BHE74_00007999 [Ensete ventricosum]